MNKLRYLLIILCMSILKYGYSQTTYGILKTRETIKEYRFQESIHPSKNSLNPIGYFNNTVLYSYCNYDNWMTQFYQLNEDNYTFRNILEDLPNSKRLYFFNAHDSLLFYRHSFINDYDDGFSKLVLKYKSKTIILDSIFNSDKKIHSSFSLDGKKLVVNTLNTLSDYYNPEQDDRFAVYSLENIKDGKFTKEYIPCKHCSDGHLIGENLFFAKSNQRDDFSGGFLWKDIYKAPLSDLNDTVKIASFSNILAITPDGKYILATRHFDLPNKPCAIIDVENKRYQLLLGRDYSKADAFYSYKEKKFAFDFEGRIVYIDFPKEYPFDALQKENPSIPKWSNKEFYQQFMHEPFE